MDNHPANLHEGRTLIELICVPPDKVAQVWRYQNIASFIREAMRRGNFGAFKPIEDAVLNGRALLWLAIDGTTVNAAAVTELITTEWRKVCMIVACGGEHMDDWLPLIAGIEKFARAENCAAVQIVGRKGWLRKLQDYRTTSIVLEKELN